MIRYDELPSLALFAEVVRARSFSEAARKTRIAKSPDGPYVVPARRCARACCSTT